MTQKLGATPKQTRTFSYDSLKRLTQAINPESSTVNYTYDENSNLKTKQDARPITTTYNYDALNRVTKRTYSDSTPEVNYYYDNQSLPATKPPNFTQANSTGRLIAMTYGGVSSSAGSYQSYDQLGRVTSSYQQTDSINYGFGYGYNLASEMTSETYPSGRQVITEYDSAGRAAGIRAALVYYAGATASDATNRIQYASHGAVSVLALGNGKWEHTNFNSRLQPTQIGLGTSGTDSSILKLVYGYGTTMNNGNVVSQTITTPSLTVNQCYGYDSLNRLTSAEEKSGGTACSGAQQWKQAFIYDRFGNRNFDPPPATTQNVFWPNPTISTSTNRIASGQGYGYDNAGNLTSDPTTPVSGVVYDAENRQTQYTKSGQAINYYYYDGDGHRVKKTDSSGTTVFVYNAGGQLIAEYTAGNPSGGGTRYLTSDHLGSTRVVVKSDGTTTRHDYLPFGEEIQAGIGGRTTGQGYVADSVRQKFTQKERDNESGLDYFLARYYSSAQGRFTSADEPLIDQWQGDPQSWNLYVYVRNNPLLFTDPTGMAMSDLPHVLAWHYEDQEIDGKKNRAVVGDYDNEKLNGLYWNAKTREWGKYHDWTPGLSSFSRGVFLDLARREKASIKLIDIAANITLTPISLISGTGLFRAGLTTLELAEAANAARLLLRSGQLLETTIQTSKGPVDVLAEIVVEGDKLVLKDLAIYGREAEPLTGLTREMLGALSKVKEAARSLGFRQLQIVAKRVATSTSANPGHIVDVTIKL